MFGHSSTGYIDAIYPARAAARRHGDGVARARGTRHPRGAVILVRLPEGRSLRPHGRRTPEERRSVNAKNTRTAGRPTRRPRPRPKGWRRFFTRKRILLTLLGLVLAGVAVVAVAWVAIGVPLAERSSPRRRPRSIYYADGKTEMDRIAQVDGNRESVPLSKVPSPRAGRGARRRGPQLLPEQRRLPRRASAAPSSRRSRGGPTQGGLDDHPAVRQELLPHPGPDR